MGHPRPQDALASRPTPYARAQAERLATELEVLGGRLEATPTWWSRVAASPDAMRVLLDARAAAGALRRAAGGPPATAAELEAASDALGGLLLALETIAPRRKLLA